MGGLFQLKELSRPHLVLAHTGHVDRLGTGNLRKLRDHLLGSHETVARLTPAKRILLTQTVEVTPPSRKVRAPQALVGLGKGSIQGSQGGLQIRNHGHVCVAILRHLCQINIDVHDACARREGVQLPGHAVIKARTQSHNQVRALQCTNRWNRTVHSRHLEVVRVRVRESSACGKRCDDCCVGQFHQRAQFFFGAGPNEATANVEHGSLGSRNFLGGASNLAWNGLECGLIAGKLQLNRPVVFKFFNLSRTGNVHQDRTGSTGRGDMEGFSQTLRDLSRAGDQEGMLCQGHRCPNDVSFLECISSDQRCADLARDHNNRDRIDIRVCDCCQSIRCTRTRGHDGNADLSACQRITLRGMSCALLVANQDVVQ